MVSKPKDNILLLLPYYLDELFADIFRDLGFKVLWAPDPAGTEVLIIEHDPDLALEWQHGTYDYPICDLLKKHGRHTPVLFLLNLNSIMIPLPEYPSFAGVSRVPFNLKELMGIFFNALPKQKRPTLLEMCRRAGIHIDTEVG